MYHWYKARLAARPILTQSVTTAILFTIGDVSAQQLVEKRGVKKHDFVRTARMTFYGGCVFGPVATTWFRILNRHVVMKNKNAELVARVMCDQFIFAPTFIGVFLSSMAFLEGSSPRQNLEKNYWIALKSNYFVWPWVQLANFKFVPLEHRVAFVNVIAIGWNCYLSYLNNR